MKAPRGSAIFLPALLALCIELPFISGDAPHIESRREKDGACPPPRNLTITPSNGQACDQQCQQDEDCMGDKKCCSDGCEKLCKTPAAVKPNVCPIRSMNPEMNATCAHSHRCTSDSECAGNLKCCMDTCGQSCLPPPGETPGFCPPNVLPPGRDLVVCRVSCAHCNETEKCCMLGCSRRCTPVSKDKPGFCPRDNVMCTALMSNLCESDTDCPVGEKCCSFKCRRQCVLALTVKPGVCPVPGTTCLHQPGSGPPPNPLCTSDYHCSGMEKCCVDECSHKCIMPN